MKLKRLDAPGLLHLVSHRAPGRRKMFLTDEDHHWFKEKIGRYVAEGGFQCYAWSLVPQGFTLLIETGRTPLVNLMLRLVTGWATRFRHRHRLRGPFFDSRFRSRVCDKESDLRDLVAQVHLEPLREGRVRTLGQLARYPWTGHRALLGREMEPWLAVDEVLSRFSSQRGPARAAYMRCLAGHGWRSRPPKGRMFRSVRRQSPIVRRRRVRTPRGLDPRILGDSDFRERVDRQLRTAAATRLTADPVVILERSAREYGLTEADLVRRGKPPAAVARARELAAALLTRLCRETMTGIARRFQVSQPAVTQMVHRGERRAALVDRVAREIAE